MLDKLISKIQPLKAKFNKFYSKKKVEFKKSREKFVSFIKENLSDVLGFSGIVVFIINSSTINIHFGMYMLSLTLLILGYISSKRR